MTEVVAARWEAPRSPRDFLARHATGARFAALPQPIKDEALDAYMYRNAEALLSRRGG